MILFLNACVRSASRTKRLADHLIGKLGDDVKEIKLWELDLPKADEAFIDRRSEFAGRNDFSDPMFDLAKDFAAADTIVIAAPYWDLSFPSVLKCYIEQICVVGLTFFYNEQDQPETLCRAKKLYYVTTAGGPVFSDEYGYGYVKALADGYYGIPETKLIKAEGLDIDGADVSAILRSAEEGISTAVSEESAHCGK